MLSTFLKCAAGLTRFSVFRCDIYWHKVRNKASQHFLKANSSSEIRRIRFNSQLLAIHIRNKTEKTVGIPVILKVKLGMQIHIYVTYFSNN